MTGRERPATEKEAQFLRDMADLCTVSMVEGMSIEAMVTATSNFLFQMAWMDAGESGIEAIRDILEKRQELEEAQTPTPEKPN